ncbi:MAG: HNH endonuclease [Gammaproteobacteria bacterium]|nr:HNH endonuclease [Gammaproteobacteria bacterium]
MASLSNPKSTLSPAPPQLSEAPKVADQFYASPQWRALIKQIKEDRGSWCEICGSTNRVIGDHIKEIKDGGSPLDPANIRLLCIGHHNEKTHREKKRRLTRIL